VGRDLGVTIHPRCAFDRRPPARTRACHRRRRRSLLLRRRRPELASPPLRTCRFPGRDTWWSAWSRLKMNFWPCCRTESCGPRFSAALNSVVSCRIWTTLRLRRSNARCEKYSIGHMAADFTPLGQRQRLGLLGGILYASEPRIFPRSSALNPVQPAVNQFGFACSPDPLPSPT
jgi:hypothetical protein